MARKCRSYREEVPKLSRGSAEVMARWCRSYREEVPKLWRDGAVENCER